MLQRAPSRLIRPRHASPRSQDRHYVVIDRACIYAFVTVLLLFCTLGIFQAKLGTPPAPANVNRLGRRSISQLPPFMPLNDEISDEHRGALKPESESLYSVSSQKRKLDDVTSGNSSSFSTIVQEDDDDGDDNDGDDEEEDETETEGDLELEEDLDGNTVEDIDVEDIDAGKAVDDEPPEKGEAADDDEEEQRKDGETKLDSRHQLEQNLGTIGHANIGTVHRLTNPGSQRVDDLVKKTISDNEVKEVSFNSNDTHSQTKTSKSLKRLGAIRTVPRWDPLEDMGGRNRSTYVSNPQNDSIQQSVAPKVAWDHLLGVFRQPGNHIKSRKFKPTSNDNSKSGQVSLVKHQTDTKNDHRQIFTSDDEILDQDVSDKVEEINAIEDALLLQNDKIRNVFVHLWTDRKPNKDRKERSIRTPFDPLNPANNPLLQDPDTPGPAGLSGSDNAILKALKKASASKSLLQSPKAGQVGSVAEGISVEHKPELVTPEDRNQTSTEESKYQTSTEESNKHIHMKLGNSADRSILEVSVSDSQSLPKNSEIKNSNSQSKSRKEKPLENNSQRSAAIRKWGYYPGLHPALTFTEFLDQFLMDKRCSINVFMAWTTPPWSYTTRYQRGLESLFYFHPQACVVVFSETIELKFFMSFLEDGFRVAVVVPNLEELLMGTPAEVFASVWLAWRNTNLFHIHYTELLRLAALYKYGGVYLDTDVVLLKPLDLLHNTVGMERLENNKHRLNGAVMAFDKSSPFLLECLVEFTETYDDRLLEFNGAELLTRVAARLAEDGENKTLHIGDLRIETSHTFFPLSRNSITRYFTAPADEQEKLEIDQLLHEILQQSITVHFWNQETFRLVPDSGSLVERIINLHCIRCHEYL